MPEACFDTCGLLEWMCPHEGQLDLEYVGVSTPHHLMNGGQGGVGFSCPPKEDFIGDRRSAATACFTSSGRRFLAKIHDCPLEECGQAKGAMCVCVCVCVVMCICC